MASKLTHEIITRYKERPTVAVLMSLGGSNAERILQDEEIRDLYNITTVVSDNPESRAEEIAIEQNLGYLPALAGRFKSPEERLAYFEHLAGELGARGIDACFYAGFMKIASGSLLDRFPGVNAHPADLTVADSNGVPRFRGMHAIDLMRDGTGGMVGASVHTVDHKVDTGDTFIRSVPISAPSELSEAECHQLVKPIEHRMYPMALRMLGRGQLAEADMPYSFDSVTGSLTKVDGSTVS